MLGDLTLGVLVAIPRVFAHILSQYIHVDNCLYIEISRFMVNPKVNRRGFFDWGYLWREEKKGNREMFLVTKQERGKTEGID